MTTFNTGNPIGSTDSRDRSDNSEFLDEVVNSLDLTKPDRFGRVRDTLEGIYQKSAYYRAGTFDAGYTLTNNRQTLAYGNVEYSWSGSFPKVVAAGATPATSGGIKVNARIDRTQETIKISLLSNSGASIVYTSTGATVEDRLSNQDTSIAGKASLAGSASQAFSVAYATTDTQAASYGQVKSRTKKGGLTQSISGNALTLSYAASLLQFRNATLTDGTAVEATPRAAMGLTVPNGATLGVASGVPMEVLVLGILNGGSPVIGVVNANGGLMLDESGLISTTAISASATGSSVVYSSVAVTNSPYIILNRLSVTLPTAGAWSILPTVTTFDLIGSSMFLRKIQSLPLPTMSCKSINVTNIPSWANRISIIFDDVKTAPASAILVQVGSSSIITTGYNGSSVAGTTGTGTLIQTATAGFVVFNTIAGTMLRGKMWLDKLSNSVIEEHLVSVKDVGEVLLGCGKLALTGGVTQLVLTTVAGNVEFSGGYITLVYEE